MASPYRWVILAIVVVGFMQTHLHRLAFAALIPTIVADLGWTYAAAGTIQTAYFWTSCRPSWSGKSVSELDSPASAQ